MQGDLPSSVLAGCIGTAGSRYLSDPRILENPRAVDVFVEGQPPPMKVARAVQDARSKVLIPENTGSLRADEEIICMTVLVNLAQLLHRIMLGMVFSSPQVHRRTSHVVQEYGS